LIYCPLAHSSRLIVLPTVIGSDFGVLGHLWLWTQNDVMMSCLRLTANSNCFPHPSLTFTKCLSTLICCPYALSICIHTVVALNSCTHTPRRRLPPRPCCRPCQPGVGSCHTGIINYTCIITLFVFVLTSWPSLCWCCRPCCAGIIDLVALVLPCLSAA
jgi:hypothetical protein